MLKNSWSMLIEVLLCGYWSNFCVENTLLQYGLLMFIWKLLSRLNYICSKFGLFNDEHLHVNTLIHWYVCVCVSVLMNGKFDLQIIF